MTTLVARRMTGPELLDVEAALAHPRFSTRAWQADAPTAPTRSHGRRATAPAFTRG